MANEKFEGMLKLVKNSSFKFDVISDDLICVYCKNVLINAHQAPCGCKFCRNCADKLIEIPNGVCPGNTDECKDNIFSKSTNISVDYRTNNIIYKLKVKCPNDNCQFECDFKNMNAHFETCENSVSGKMKNGLEIENLHKDNEIISLVNRLLESVTQLKDQEDANKIEIDQLKEMIQKNNSKYVTTTVEIVQNEIQKSKKLEESRINDDPKLKVNGDHHSSVIVGLKHELRKRETEIGMVNQEINNIKTTYSDEFKQRMEVHFNDKLASFIKEMKTIYESELIRMRQEFLNMSMSSKNQEAILCANCDMEKNDSDNKENIESVAQNGHLVDPFIWCVDDLSDKTNKGATLHSTDFFSQDKCYLVRMLLSASEDAEQNDETEWSIDLQLIDEGCEVGKGFPMTRNITINIFNQANNLTPLKSFSKLCSMNKSDRYSIIKFAHSDICPETALKNDSITIQCIV